MHIYYYYKDGYAYVMDNNHKLYRYHDNINLETILKLENLITKYTNELYMPLKRFPFKSYEELDLQTQYNMQQLVQGILLLQWHYLNNFFIGLTELALGDILNKLIAKLKQEITNKRNLEDSILMNRLQEFKKEYNLLKNIGIVKKEEVSLSYLDPTISKQYINTLELEQIYQEITKKEENYKIVSHILQKQKNLYSLFPRMGIYGTILSEFFIKYETTNPNEKKYAYYIQIFFCLLFLLGRYSISKINKEVEKMEEVELSLKRKNSSKDEN